MAARALRTVLAVLDNAEAVEPSDDPAPSAHAHVAGSRAGLHAAEAPRRHLDEAQQVALVRAEAVAWQTDAEALAGAGQPARAEELRHEAAVVRRALEDHP